MIIPAKPATVAALIVIGLAVIVGAGFYFGRVSAKESRGPYSVRWVSFPTPSPTPEHLTLNPEHSATPTPYPADPSITAYSADPFPSIPGGGGDSGGSEHWLRPELLDNSKLDTPDNLIFQSRVEPIVSRDEATGLWKISFKK